MAICMFNPQEDGAYFTPGTSNGTGDYGGSKLEVPVVIIGGGPAGLLQAHLLSELGVRCVVVEKYPERLGAPKAHALSPRSLEICRQFHLDTKEIRKLGTQRKDAYWVNFLTSLSGTAVGRLPYERMDAGVLDATPEVLLFLPSPKDSFEQYLTERLAKSPLVEIRKGVSFVSLTQTSGGVQTVVSERATGSQFTIQSQYVIACDGARSAVRGYLNVESEGEDSYETMMTIHFNANLRDVVGDRVGMLHWVLDPLASGFIIAYDLSGNAVLISNFDENKHPVASWTQELCRQVVISAIGKDVPFDVLSYRPWLLSRKVANQYRVGRVFLAGDAAHSFPPTGGLGLNSGLADVHNLAYKIACVLQSKAGDSLLDSYEAERRHVAIVNSRQSVKNGQKIFALLKAMGIGEDLVQARKNLYATIRDSKRKQAIDHGIEEQREHFDNLELHIGYVYGDPSIPPHASHYTPKFVPGSRLPHCWIRLGQSDLAPIDVSYVAEFLPEEVEARRYSTLDLVPPSKFVLLGDVPSVLGVKTLRPGHDFHLRGEAGQRWLEDSGLRSGSALLVRPDQHILAVFTRTEATAENVLAAVARHLHHSPSSGVC